jgi:hypothetical protein
MVSFAEQGQDIQPANTSFWARPIEQPKSDISKGTIAKTIGSALGEGIKFADDYVREGIVAPQVANQAGELRDQFVDALNTARQSVEPQPLGAPKTLTPEQKANLPQAVQQAGNKVEMLGKAMESGRLSETDYYGRVNALAKQLRSQYPGYRDEVDREIARVTGVHPANQYIRGMIGDLNRLVAQHGEIKDKIETRLEHAENSGLITAEESKLFHKQHDAGTLSIDAIGSLIAGRAYQKAQQEKARFDWANEEHDAKSANKKAIQDLTTSVTDATNNSLDTIKIARGQYAGQNLQEVLTKYGTGELEIPDTDWEYLSAQLKVQRENIFHQAMKAANAPITMKDGTKSTLAAQIRGTGEKTAEEVINAALAPWDHYIATAGGKDFSMHHYAGEVLEATKNDINRNAVTNDPNLALDLAHSDLIRKNMGDQAFASFVQNNQSVTQRLDKGYRALFLQDREAGMLQLRKQQGGAAYELVSHLKDAQNKGVDQKEFYQYLLKGADMITDKETDPKSRANLIDYYFGPMSGQLVVTATGGKENAYSMLYTPLMAKTISKNNPDKYEMFMQGAEQNARALFQNTLNSLSNTLRREVPGTVTLNWNGSEFTATGEGRGFVQDKIDSINTMVRGLKSVYDHDPSHKGMDAETAMFKQMIEAGFDPRQNVNGLPSKIMNALMAHKGQGNDNSNE